MNLINCATDVIDRFNMFSSLDVNNSVVVGVSGGADSIALLHFLKFNLNLYVIACHINHKLRGEESYRDMNFVVNICDEWDIPCVTREIDVKIFAQENSLGLEQAGRFVRYREFDLVASENNALKIATAHTLSDTAETVLLNLTRGAGLHGLCGIPVVRDNIVRPLIECTREQVEEYCSYHSLKFVNDSSNFTDDFSRNNIRNNVIPILKDINPGFMSSILRCTTLLKQDDDFINSQVNECLLSYNEISNGIYDITLLPTFDIAIRSRIISYILDSNNIKKSFYLINAIDKIIMFGSGIENISAESYIQVCDSKLIIKSFSDNIKAIDYFEHLLPTLNGYGCENPYSFSCIWGDLFSIATIDKKKFTIDKKNISKDKNILSTDKKKLSTDEKNIEKNDKKQLLFFLDYDKIEGSAFIRQRKVGDKIEFNHRKGTRVLKKLFINAKLSNYEKSKVLVFADNIGVFAVLGFGVASRVCVDDNTRTILAIYSDNS